MENVQPSPPPEGQPPASEDVLADRLRWLLRAQPGVFGLLVVLVAWFALHGLGLGSHGLWDPWEMDRAHVARQMVGSPRVMVVERPVSKGQLGPIATWLNARYRDSVVVVTPELPPAGAVSPTKVFDRSATRLEEDIFHVVLVHLPSVVPDVSSPTQVTELVAFLARVVPRNANAKVILVSALTADDTDAEVADRLRQTAARIRVELTARELRGEQWGKPGTFRRNLAKLIRDAHNVGYSAAPGLTPPASENFADSGFWKAVEKRKLDRRFVAPAPESLIDELAASERFALQLPIVPWPEGDDFAALLDDFRTGEQTARAPAVAAAAAVENVIDEQRSVTWLRPVGKHEGTTRELPPFDHWLTAVSYSLLGFNELSTRLPAFLVGLLALLLVFRSVNTVWGPVAATLTGLVLCTSPLFFASARSVSGSTGAMLGLTMSGCGYLLAVARGKVAFGPLPLILTGAAISFFSMGLVGLVLPLVLGLTFLLVARTLRFDVLVPVALLGAIVGALVIPIATAQPGDLWNHFSLENPLLSWNVALDDRPVRFNFDNLVRQIGFGAAPWSALLPFAFGVLLLEASGSKRPEHRRAGVLVCLWFFTAFALQSAFLKQNNHLVFPAIAAVGIAVGLFLERLYRGVGLGALPGFVAAVLLGLLYSNLKKSPEPLTSFLTVDPPLIGFGEEKDYPEALTLPSLLKMTLLLSALLFLAHGMRLATRVRLVMRFFTRPRPNAVTLGIVVSLLAALLLYGLESQIASAFGTREGRALETVHRLFVRDVFYWRPHLWALWAVAALGFLTLMAAHTRVFALGWAWLRRWVFTATQARAAAALMSIGTVGVALGALEAPDAVLIQSGVTPVVLGLVIGLAMAVGRGRDAAVDLAVPAAVAGITAALAGSTTGAVAAGLGVVLLNASARLPGAFVLSLALAVGALGGWPEPAEFGVIAVVSQLLNVAVIVATLFRLGRWFVPAIENSLPGALRQPLAGWNVLTFGLVVGGPIVATSWLSAAPQDDIVRDASQMVWVLAGGAVSLLVLSVAGRWAGLDGRGLRRLSAPAAALGRRLSSESVTFHVVHLVLSVSLALAALVVLLTQGQFPEDDFMTWATVQSPLFIAGVVALLLVGAAAAYGRSHRTSLFGPVGRASVAIPLFTGVTLVLLAGLFGQLFPESGLRNLDFLALRPERRTPEAAQLRTLGFVAGNLLLGSALVAFHGVWRALRRHATAAYVVTLVAGAWAVTLMVVAMSAKWRQLAPAVQAPGDEPFLAYLFYGSRRTLLLYAMVSGLIGLRMLGALPGWWAKRTGLHRRAARFEGWLLAWRRPWAFAAAAAGLLVVAFAAGVDGPGRWVLASVPPLMWVGWLPPFRFPTRLDGTSAIIVRGLFHGLVGLLPWLAAGGIAVALTPTGSRVLLHAVLAFGVFALVWSGAVVLRLSLGVADVLGALPISGPLALGAGVLAAVDIALVVGRATPTGGAWLVVAIAALAIFLLALNFVARWTPPWRAAELLERPRVFVPVMAMVVAGFAFFYNQSLVKALSFHVSQKHILTRLDEADPEAVASGRLFQHGLSGGQSRRNFYLSEVGEVKDAKTVLGALAGESDQVVPVQRAGSSITEYRVVQGFSADNDTDGDGLRDAPADAARVVALDADAGWVQVRDRDWAPKQWVGAVMYDQAGWTYPVVGSDADRLFYDAANARSPSGGAPSKRTPKFSLDGGPGSLLRVVSPELENHTATGRQHERVFALLPKVGSGAPSYSDKGSFSSLNHRYRQLTGRHLAVIDDRSSRILLATSELRDGEEDKNWLRKALITDEQFIEQVKSGQIRGAAPETPLGGMATWDDAITLIGWSMDSYSISKGKKFTLRLYFKSVKPVKTSYKIFIHADRSGHRIHTDHWPLAVSMGTDGKHCIGCFQTDHWMPGDIVVDEYTREVPYGAPSGETTLYMGLFNPAGDKRVKITSYNGDLIKYNGKDNRPGIGAFVVR